MSGYASLVIGLVVLGAVLVVWLAFALFGRSALDNPDVANDTRHVDAFVEDDPDHTVVHFDDVGHELY